MSSSPFGFATRASLSLSLPVSLSSPRVVSALVALDVPPISSLSPPFCRYLTIPEIFSPSPPKSSPPLELHAYILHSLPLSKLQTPTLLRDLPPSSFPPGLSFILRFLLHFCSPPFLLSNHVEGFTSATNNKQEEGERGRGVRNRSDLRPASEKGNLGEPHTANTGGGGRRRRKGGREGGEGPVDNERPAGR